MANKISDYRRVKYSTLLAIGILFASAHTSKVWACVTMEDINNARDQENQTYQAYTSADEAEYSYSLSASIALNQLEWDYFSTVSAVCGSIECYDYYLEIKNDLAWAIYEPWNDLKADRTATQNAWIEAGFNLENVTNQELCD